MKLANLLLFLVFFAPALWAQAPLETDKCKVEFSRKGLINRLNFKETETAVSFLNPYFKGPQWYLQIGDSVISPEIEGFENHTQKAGFENLAFEIAYKVEGKKLLIEASIQNNGKTPFQPVKAGIRLGVDTYMQKFPDWNKNFFPTLLRCEKTHFWGYFMTPEQKILAIGSPDAVASWSHEYSQGWNDGPYYYQGHHVTSANIDFMNALPLPKRHPQDLWELMPGETKTFRLYLSEANSLDEIPQIAQNLTDAPSILLEETAGEPNKKLSFSVLSAMAPSVKIISPEGEEQELKANKNGDAFNFVFDQTATEGLYTISATANGKVSEANFYVRKPYSWYMQQAMKAVQDYPPKASFTHCESWYGFYTSFAGGKFFKESEYLKYADKEFAKIYPHIFDTLKLEPKKHLFRIQNVSTMIGILVDRYELFGDESDLTDAIGLADFLTKAQYADGAYRASASDPDKDKEANLKADGAYRAKPTHYTCVIYIAKSMMELLDVLETKKKDRTYKKAYARIYASVEKAIDELERSRANIETEGGLTFEDGMISCSSLQLGKFALMQKNSKLKEKYTAAAIDMLTQHDCLEQLQIPDARMRSATLRFWEAQYDVLIGENFLNSTHGWSSWTTYANYYAYLLTGEEKYLIRTFNGLDAGMQSIGLDGTMRWSFTPNPYVKAHQIYENIEGSTPMNVVGMHYNVAAYDTKSYVLGEQYIGMVSDWFFANANDNDVHEHFKCLEEVALGKAYVVERENGELLAFNCTASKNSDGSISITPSEKIIAQVHVNLKKVSNISVTFATGEVKQEVDAGMNWIK